MLYFVLNQYVFNCDEVVLKVLKEKACYFQMCFLKIEH